jgi:hypothetical protein
VSFVLRNDHPGAGYPTYITVTTGFENHINPQTVGYDPGRERAYRFHTREEAERVQVMLSGGTGRITIEEEES